MWDPYALSTRYFVKLSIRAQWSLPLEHGQRCDFATIDRHSYGYKVGTSVPFLPVSVFTQHYFKKAKSKQPKSKLSLETPIVVIVQKWVVKAFRFKKI